MSEVALRAPADDDWQAILALAETSLTEFPSAPSQLEWLNNRKSFALSDGHQQHFVAVADDQIVGYACIEHRNNITNGRKPVDGVYRLFVVVAPSARTTLGSRLLETFAFLFSGNTRASRSATLRRIFFRRPVTDRRPIRLAFPDLETGLPASGARSGGECRRQPQFVKRGHLP